MDFVSRDWIFVFWVWELCIPLGQDLHGFRLWRQFRLNGAGIRLGV